MEHVINRMDNYYDANGLMMIGWKFAEDNEDEIETIIEVGRLMDENVLSVDEITDNVKRWLKEVI